MSNLQIPPAVVALQRTPDGQLAQLLRAVVGQDMSVLTPVSERVRLPVHELNFLVISEAANRWLTAQGQG
jgi:hypothetical protein